jgi:hypothetical protein
MAINTVALAEKANPAIDIKEAIRRAEAYLVKKQINLDGYYIRSASYEHNERDFWCIMWEKPGGGIGDHYSVIIYRDGTVVGVRGA